MTQEATAKRIAAARSEWKGFLDLARRPETGALSQALAALLFLVRWLPGVNWWTPFRWYDSWGYAALDIPGYPAVLDLLGNAPRPWPVPMFYAIASNDQTRVGLQVLCSSLAWSGLIAVAGRKMRSPIGVAVLAGAISLLSFSEQARGWDAMILSESLTITLSVLLVIGVLRFLDRPMIGRAIAAGAVAGILVTIRPALIPTCLLLVAASLWMIRGGPRRPIAAGLIVFAVFMTYAAATHGAQQRAFLAFERDFRGRQVVSTQEDETWMSLLYSRYLLDADMRGWLRDKGAPPLERGMVPMEGADNLVNWNSFLVTYFSSERWQQWYRDNGGPRLFVTVPLETPVTHLRLFLEAAPFVLWSGWGEPPSFGGSPLSGPPTPSIHTFFTRVGVTPLDLAVLALVVLVLRLFVPPRRPPSLVGRVGAATTLGAAVATLSAWLLTGTDLIRHAVPGPIMLRVGLVLLAAEAVDRACACARRTAVAPAVAT